MFWLKWFQRISQKRKPRSRCAITTDYFLIKLLYICSYVSGLGLPVCRRECIVDWVVCWPAAVCWNMGMKWRCCRDRLSLLLPQINYAVTIGVCLIWELISCARQMALPLPPVIKSWCCHTTRIADISPHNCASLIMTHTELSVLSCCTSFNWLNSWA